MKGVEDVRKENEPSRDRQSVAGDDGRRRTDNADLRSDRRGEPRKTEENSGRLETEGRNLTEEQPVKTPKEIEQQAKEMNFLNGLETNINNFI